MIRLKKICLLQISLLVISFFSLSCSYREKADFWNVSGNNESNSTLYALSRNAVSGVLPLSSAIKLDYSVTGLGNLDDNYSLEISYMLEGSRDQARGQAVIELDNTAWELPRDFSFLDNSVLPDTYRASQPLNIKYIIPVRGSLEHLSLSWQPESSGSGQGSSLVISNIELTPRWFGVSFNSETNTLRLSPFVFSRDSGLVMDIPPVFDYGYSTGDAATSTAAESTAASSALSSNLEPIIANTRGVLNWPLHEWRIRNYELFRWSDFPSILIFDFLNYDVQDRFLKRLAFYVEKAGFRGRLAQDHEIADLHGWNAHDYSAESLADFFDLAERTNFPLLSEELELKEILLDSGIIIRNFRGNIIPGRGAIISLTRESPDYLRATFMAHEAYHGIFFIDEDFRRFTRQRWNNIDPIAGNFFLAYLDLQVYDINDEYLVLKEFSSFLLQQPVSQAARYFGQTLPSRLENSPLHRAALPARDQASGTWPILAALFQAEAEAFSQYVNQRWGFAAGRVHQQ